MTGCIMRETVLPTKHSVSMVQVMPRTPSTRTRNDPDVRREQILDEAIRIIGLRGFYGFTIQELAQACGLSNAGLLYHFGSREQLFVALVEEIERREAEVMAPLVRLAEQDASAAAIRDLLRTMVIRAAAQPELGRLHSVLLAESLDKAHPAYEPFRARETKVLALIERLVAPHVAEPRITARQLVALMQGLGLQWLRADQDFDLLAVWDRTFASLLPELGDP